jgi:RecB family endonuclease NucS
MSSPIFIPQKDEREDDKIIQMEELPFNEEKDLQQLLAKHPELLLSDYLGIGNSNLLLVKREAMVPGDEVGSTTFYLDHLFLDRDGIPTLVEVKRSSNTQIRREIDGTDSLLLCITDN